MDVEPLGLHHVTAIAGDPQRNVEFYLDVLGLRLVKRTVNFDAPDTYHLYYGDEVGHPGTILTFFPWPGAPRGRRGTGQTTTVAFSVPESSLGYWAERVRASGATMSTPHTREGEDVLVLLDPDGLQLELVAHPDADPRPPWEAGPVPAERAIRGLDHVALSEMGYEMTAGLLVDQLGFRLSREDGNRFRFDVGEGGPGARVDVLCQPDAPRGLVAAGTVHHVAWRAPDDPVQLDWRARLVEQGLDVTPVLDRQYFHSIYFREPGGVLFEIATDPPGFTKDEPVERLGQALRLPPWLESERSWIERQLPELKVPERPGRPEASPPV
ncbi:MAG: ring-cleaving dioxygenase [Nitriliruptorales bacterium]|nr:ring-cleaving dioxygenase [Nitriliruptorales bacterium]